LTTVSRISYRVRPARLLRRGSKSKIVGTGTNDSAEKTAKF